MKKINYTVDSNNIITSWRTTPYNEAEPYIEVEDNIQLNVGFDKIIDGKLIKDIEGYQEYMEGKKLVIDKLSRINYLKQYLASTDYQAIKFAEGEISEADYTPIKEQRRAYRAEINQLEAEITNL